MIVTTDLRAARCASEMPMDDPALVEALRSGDPQAPRLLIERYQGVVFGLCYRMMNHQQDAEESLGPSNSSKSIMWRHHRCTAFPHSC